MTSQFIQLHCLTSYGASLLNRDDVGLAKRLPYGDSTRTRVSSQCLKRHWRTHEGEHGLDTLAMPSTLRSRQTFERHVVAPLVEAGGDQEIIRAVTSSVMELVLGKSAKAEEKSKKKGTPQDGEPLPTLATNQVTVLGDPEITFLRERVQAIVAEVGAPKDAAKAVKAAFDKEAKKNLEGLAAPAGLSAAMFGRMVTGDILARVDAAIHVAHAFTVHAEQAEPDYFSAVDDLCGEAGSGHINSTELTSGLFYGYVVIDVPLLVSNLEGVDRKAWQTADRSTAAKLIERLVHLIATVSPGAKLGSTAPYAYAELVLAEWGAEQPRSLGGAFLRSVRPQPDLRANAYRALDGHLRELSDMYGLKGERVVAARGLTSDASLLSELPTQPLSGLASWLGQQVLA